MRRTIAKELGKSIEHGLALQTTHRLRELVLAGVVLGGLTACSQAPELITMPAAEEVTQITVSRAAKKRVIEDRAAITSVLTILKQANQDWSVPFTTYPTPQLTMVLNLRGGDPERIFWLGNGWLGTQSQVIEVGDEKMHELRRILGED